MAPAGCATPELGLPWPSNGYARSTSWRTYATARPIPSRLQRIPIARTPPATAPHARAELFVPRGPKLKLGHQHFLPILPDAALSVISCSLPPYPMCERDQHRSPCPARAAQLIHSTHSLSNSAQSLRSSSSSFLSKTKQNREL